MSRLDPPQVLIERSALLALADSSHPRYGALSAVYRALVEDYRHDRVLLVAVDRHMRPVAAGPGAGWRAWWWFLLPPRLGRFAPIDPLRTAFQHRRAVQRMADRVDDPDVALTLLHCERHRVRRMLTLDERFAGFELHLEPIAEVGAPADRGPGE